MATFGNLETTVEPLATLMREHTELHGLVTAAQEAVVAAIGGARPADALPPLRALDDYMAEQLVFHMAIEEEVLFPALRGFAAEMDKVVDEMVEQHDEVRAREAILQRALAAVAHTHSEVNAGRTELAGLVATAAGNIGAPGLLEELLDGLRRLDWILQGHFGDEEDDLFVPALEILSPETFAELARQAEALEAL